MQIQVTTDHNIEGNQALFDQVNAAVSEALGSFSAHITRVEVHLSDENGDKKTGVNAFRCVMEVRLSGRKPEVVTEDATTLEQSFSGAAEKLARLVVNIRGRERAKEKAEKGG